MANGRCWIFEPGLDYIVAFYSCLYAGVTAVPVYPPDPFRIGRTWNRLAHMAGDAQARFTIISSTLKHVLGSENQGRRLADVLIEASCGLQPEIGVWSPAATSPNQTALLQYTSGSTAQPKGVLITNDNLLHNMQAIHEQFDADNVVGVSWLPPYHDLGLVGGVLQPVFSGRRAVFMSPLAFMQRPVRWLRAITKYRAHTSGGPNFAYDLCVRKISADEKAGLNLETWKLACNGAEPVRSETLRRFVEAFGPVGFSPSAFFPCYGLAEGTLLVSGGRDHAAPRTGRYDAAALAQGQAVFASNGGEARRTGELWTPHDGPHSPHRRSADRSTAARGAGGRNLGQWTFGGDGVLEPSRGNRVHVPCPARGPFIRTSPADRGPWISGRR